MYTVLMIWLLFHPPPKPEFMKISWYGKQHHGRLTASGIKFNMNELTAAHKTLPFGTKLQITHKENWITVIINDRGPYIQGRHLDVSYAAAKALDMIGEGVIIGKVYKLK